MSCEVGTFLFELPKIFFFDLVPHVVRQKHDFFLLNSDKLLSSIYFPDSARFLKVEEESCRVPAINYWVLLTLVSFIDFVARSLLSEEGGKHDCFALGRLII